MTTRFLYSGKSHPPQASSSARKVTFKPFNSVKARWKGLAPNGAWEMDRLGGREGQECY